MFLIHTGSLDTNLRKTIACNADIHVLSESVRGGLIYKFFVLRTIHFVFSYNSPIIFKTKRNIWTVSISLCSCMSSFSYHNVHTPEMEGIRSKCSCNEKSIQNVRAGWNVKSR